MDDAVKVPGRSFRPGTSFVERIDRFGGEDPDRIAFFNSAGEQLTYGELTLWSDALALRLADAAIMPDAASAASAEPASAGCPIAVYGHKSPLMLVAFLACVKSGHPYVPLESSLPAERIAAIVDQLSHPLVLDACGGFPAALLDRVSRVIAVDPDELAACTMDLEARSSARAHCVTGDDTFYILFTSGSTGVPKGVEVSAANVDAFLAWMEDAFCPGERQVFFNRAPFSFDLSVTDLVRGLGAGDTLFALEAEAEAGLAAAFEALGRSGVTFWVSTPSFADMCLADPAFSRDLMPDVHTFFFVGETLRNQTALQLLERFPGCRVVNGYGPTESTVLVTATEIDRATAHQDAPLPVGYPKPGIRLDVRDPETLEVVPTGAPGELFVIGDTVAKGYFGMPEATERAFASYPGAIGAGERSYRTGDCCSLDADGMLRFHGRYDFQVKLHGYRIELGDIEAHLNRLAAVRQACVLPIEKNGTIAYLRAVVQLAPGFEPVFATTRALKAALAQELPGYMVPRTVSYSEEFPLNANGKIDRAALARTAEGA